jgi:hypothetical protein
MNREGEPGQQPQMAETEFGVDEIQVLMQALQPSPAQLDLIRRTVGTDLVGTARLHTGQNTDQPLGDSVPLRDVAGEVFLGDGRAVQVDDRPPRLLRSSLHRLAQLVRDPLRIGREVLPLHLNGPQKPPQPGDRRQPPQRAAKPDAVESTQHSHDIGLVLSDKLLHGVAPWANGLSCPTTAYPMSDVISPSHLVPATSG